VPLVICAVGVLTCGFEPAENFRDNVQVVERGTSSRAAREQALAALPLDKLSAEDRREAQSILSAISVFRELPTCQFEVEPEVYRFFADHPDVAVSIWRAMKISKFEMTQTGDGTYDVDGRDGTQGSVKVVYSTPQEHLMLCQGSFKSPVAKGAIRARALLHMQTSFAQNAEGKSVATHRLCFFASFPSHTIETAARIISPVSNTIIDRNFRETSLFVYMMSYAMARQPAWVERLADDLDGVQPSQRDRLLNLTAQVYIADQKRIAKALGHDDVTLQEILDSPHEEATNVTASADAAPTE
jgi:hypothetical protein